MIIYFIYSQFQNQRKGIFESFLESEINKDRNK
jgi:hypothetical protein